MIKTKSISAKDKILETANDLFYKQGYYQTGINQIIEEAGVAKATFYSNFKTKEDLCVEYLRERDRIEMKVTKDILNKISDPLDKYTKLAEGFVEWMESSNYRGCGFNNMVIEIIDPSSPIRKEAKFHNDAFKSILTDIVTELKNSHKKYNHLDIEYIVNTYFILVEGAIISSQVYNDSWPLKHIVKVVKDLLKS